MINIIMVIFCPLILMISIVYAWHVLTCKKINFRNYKLYISLVGMLILTVTSFFVVNDFVRITLVTIILILFFKYLFNEDLHKSIVTPVYVQIIVFIAEFIYSITLLFIFNDKTEDMINDVLFNFSTNIVVAILLIIFVQFKFIKKVYNMILKSTDKINSTHLGILCIVGMLVLNIFLTSSYYKIEIQYFLILNVIIILLVLVVIFNSLITKNQYNKVANKYNIAIKSLKNYEDMITKYKISNHENKNLLLTIRAMIINKEKGIPEYIDSIIEEKYLDDEKLLFKISSIPTGGLRATIYSEILKIKKNNINYFLNIDNSVRTADLIELDTDTVIDICKIIGVFIDNSIEAVTNLKSKNIDINLYVENKKMCIKVSNNYIGNIDIDKIFDEGYTTKGKGHGYGLSLVRDIVKNNTILENRTEISKNIFSQIIIIKYKKAH